MEHNLIVERPGYLTFYVLVNEKDKNLPLIVAVIIYLALRSSYCFE